jgi:predicted naringenin-chalcone synthase
MSVLITGLSTAQPALKITQPQALAMALEQSPGDPAMQRLLPILYRRSGITTRHFTPGTADFYPKPKDAADRGPTTQHRMSRYAVEALPLALHAAQQALAVADVKPAEITHIVVCSCTGLYSPGIDIQLIDALKLPPTTARTMIGFMGCHASFNAMALAGNIVRANPSARVLTVAVELCSLHFQYHADTQQAVANALFADGAAASVVQFSDTAHPTDSWSLLAAANCLFPDSQDAMTWIIGDHGYQMTLSPRVPDLIQAHLPPFIDSWLASHSLTRADIAHWAIHPGGPRIVESVESALSLPPGTGDISRQVLATCGNMSSATILFILQHLRRSSSRSSNGPCVAIGFGPGLVAEVLLLQPA